MDIKNTFHLIPYARSVLFVLCKKGIFRNNTKWLFRNNIKRLFRNNIKRLFRNNIKDYLYKACVAMPFKRWRWASFFPGNVPPPPITPSPGWVPVYLQLTVKNMKNSFPVVSYPLPPTKKPTWTFRVVPNITPQNLSRLEEYFKNSWSPKKTIQADIRWFLYRLWFPRLLFYKRLIIHVFKQPISW